MAGAGGLKIVDRVEVDERHPALRRLRSRLRLPLLPPPEQLRSLLLAEQEPGPEPVEDDRRQRTWSILRIQGIQGQVGPLERARRVVSESEVDELWIDPGRQLSISGCGG